MIVTLTSSCWNWLKWMVSPWIMIRCAVITECPSKLCTSSRGKTVVTLFSSQTWTLKHLFNFHLREDLYLHFWGPQETHCTTQQKNNPRRTTMFINGTTYIYILLTIEIKIITIMYLCIYIFNYFHNKQKKCIYIYDYLIFAI